MIVFFFLCETGSDEIFGIFRYRKKSKLALHSEITQVLKLLTAQRQSTSKGPPDLFAEEPETKFLLLLLLLLSLASTMRFIINLFFSQVSL